MSSSIAGTKRAQPEPQVTAPTDERALTHEERRDRWRRQAGTMRWGSAGSAASESQGLRFPR